MKWQLLVLFLSFFIKGYSQKQENEYKRMTDSAISIAAQKVLKLNRNLSTDSASGTKGLYLIDENNLSYKHTGMFAGLDFKGINVLGPRNKVLLKKGIHAWKIIPALEGNRLKVTIIDFLITYKNGNYNYSTGGGSEIVFEYSCNENRWVLAKTKYQGL